MLHSNRANQVPGNVSIRVTDDVTTTQRISYYANLQAIRIVNHAESIVGQIADLFLGQPNEPATITAMNSQMRSGLDVLAENGAFNGGFGSGYTFTITPGTGGQLGTVNISLSIRPAFEIRFIKTEVTVTL